MIGSAKTALGISAFGAALAAGSAWAQTGDRENSAATRGQLEDIVVTARRSEERLMQTPVAVTSVSAQALEKAAATDLARISELAPQVIITTTDAGTGGTFSIRGVGSSQSDAGLDQSVLINIDGINAGRGNLTNQGFFDLQQVEVMKGPQALFFGKNSPGGVISLRSINPTDKLEGYVRAGYEFKANQRYVEAAISGPLSDTLKARIAGRGSKMRGWMRNNAVALASNPRWGGLPTPGAIEQYNGGEELLGRATIIWTPTPEFDATLKVSGGKYKSNGSSTQPICDTSFPGAPTVPTVSGLNDPGGDCKFDGNTTKGNIPVSLAVDAWPNIGKGRPYEDVWSTLTSLTMNYNMPNLTLTSVTGFYKLSSHKAADFGFSSYASTFVASSEATKQWSQELRLVSDYDSPVNFVVGGYYENLKRDNLTASYLGYAGVDPATGKPETYDNSANNKAKTISAFGQIRWAWVPSIEFTAGARYTHEEKRVKLQNLFVQPVSPIPGLSPVGRVLSGTFRDSNWSPEATLSWKPNSDTLIYAAYKTGYKSGGFSNAQVLRASQDLAQGLSYASERAKGFEVGGKLQLADRTVRLELTAYSYKYSDQQVAFFDQQTFSYVVRNAAALRTKGVELSAAWLPIEGLRLNGTAAYNRARYLSFPLFPCFAYQTRATGCTIGGSVNPVTGIVTGGRQDLSGQPSVRAPDWNLSAGFNYDYNISNNFILSINGNANYISKYFSSEDHAPISLQDGYASFNAGISMQTADENWKISLIGTNITNKYYLKSVNQKTNGAPTQYIGPTARPREIHIQGTYRF